MVDVFVTATQNWLQGTYGDVPGWVDVTVDGQTGNSTVAALIRALQHELGITALSSTFGPGTLSALTTFGNITTATTAANRNVVRIVQGALYCKGYDAKGYNGVTGALDGNYADSIPAVKQLRIDMGVGAGDGSVTPKIFKGLLTTDAAVLIPGGKPVIRQIQQDLNRKYLSRRDFYLMPTDGIYSRNVQVSLLFALQYELGLADGTANGNFGPTTQANLRTQGALAQGSSDGAKYLVHLFQAALNFNGYPVTYDGIYGAGTASTVGAFQAFAGLSVTNGASFETWASLLVSTGDPTRPATAADCVTTITAPRAATLVAAGYRTIGRYLTNTPDNIPNKNIKPGELATIFAAGMSVFPIFQTGGATPSHFTREKGLQVANEAYAAARSYGFKRGAIIYFTVDWDALDVDIDVRILPYFKRLNERFQDLGSFYRIGVYGPRNICSRVSAAGYAVSSFVSGMSTGYSGNLGFPLPSNWAFDQIATVTIGAGTTGAIEIDRNSKRSAPNGYAGETAVETASTAPVPATQTPDVLMSSPSFALFDQVDAWVRSKLSLEEELLVYRTPKQVLTEIFSYDDLFTSLAVNYRMRKSLIQTTIEWESATVNPEDTGADTLVRLTFDYERAKEAHAADPSLPSPVALPVQSADSSTGLGQIFAGTAIDAINWGHDAGYTNEPKRNAEDWHDREVIWERLNTDDRFNIAMTALVLLRCAVQTGRSLDTYTWGAGDVKAVLSRYNDSNIYGERNYELYQIFEAANAAERN